MAAPQNFIKTYNMKLINTVTQQQIIIQEVNNDFIIYTLHCSSCTKMNSSCPLNEVKILRLLTTIDRGQTVVEGTLKHNQSLKALDKMVSLPQFSGFSITADTDQCWLNTNYNKLL